MKKKLLSLCLAGAMVFSLTGCSMSFSLGGGPKTAADVVEKYVSAMEEAEPNYHVDLDMDFEIAASGDGMDIELPIKMGMSADVLGESMHGNMDISMSFMGEKMKTSSEVYVETGRKATKTYTYDDEYGYWTVTEEDKGAGLATGITSMNLKAFEDAEMEHDSKSGTYTVTQSFADFAKYSDVYESMEEMYGDMADLMSMDPDDFLDEWEDAKVIYVFDKDCMLTSVSIEGCEFSDTIKEDGVEFDVTVTLRMGFEFSDYGKIEEDDVEVPDDVKEDAVPSVSMELDEDDYHVSINGEEHGSLEAEKPKADEDVPVQAEEIDPGFSVNPAQGKDTLGAYNGTPLTGQGDSWDSTFGTDGWTFEDSDGEYSFAVIENSRYEDVEAYVYNKERTGTTSAQVKEEGFYGYSVDCAYMRTANYPPMTWNGITFGASAEDVTAAYGSPVYSYEGSMYKTYEYEITDDIELVFYVYPDKGLQRVTLNSFSGF